MVWKSTPGSTRTHNLTQHGQNTNRAMKTKELSVDLRDQIVERHKSGQGYKRISKGLNVPRSTVASIIIKWKKLGTTLNLPRIGRPAELDIGARNALMREVRTNQTNINFVPGGGPRHPKQPSGGEFAAPGRGFFSLSGADRPMEEDELDGLPVFAADEEECDMETSSTPKDNSGGRDADKNVPPSQTGEGTSRTGASVSSTAAPAQDPAGGGGEERPASPLISIKDEPVDEGYDKALLSSGQSDSSRVKEELENGEQESAPPDELRISSVFSVRGNSEAISAAPVAPQAPQFATITQPASVIRASPIVLQAQMPPQFHAHLQLQPKTLAQLQPHLQAQLQAQLQSQLQPQLQLQAQLQARLQTQLQTQLQPSPQPQLQRPPRPSLQPSVQAPPKAQLQPHTQPQLPAPAAQTVRICCSGCSKVLQKGQTAFQKKGSNQLFCSTVCLTGFTLPPAPVVVPRKTCHLCLKAIANLKDLITVPVDSSNTLKEFCSLSCLSIYKSRVEGLSKDVVRCSMCRSPKEIVHEVNHQGVVHRLCSDDCFLRFRSSKRISMSCCESCGNCTVTGNYHLVQVDDAIKKFCSPACISTYKQKSGKRVQCPSCQDLKAIDQMLEGTNAQGVIEFFCSARCVANSQASCTLSGASFPCTNCQKLSVPQYHLAMPDGSIRNFCTYECVAKFQERVQRSAQVNGGSHSAPHPAPHPTSAQPFTSQQHPTQPTAPAPRPSSSHESVRLSCKQCQRPFCSKPELLQLKNHAGVFCSRLCCDAYKREKEATAACEYCREEKVVKDVVVYDRKPLSFCCEGCKLLYKHNYTKQHGGQCRVCAYCCNVTHRTVHNHFGGKLEEFCSQECMSLHTVLFYEMAKCHGCKNQGTLKESLRWDGTVRHFCNLPCLLQFCAKNVVHHQPSTNGITSAATSLCKDMPIIGGVVSLASALAGNTAITGALPTSDASSKTNDDASTQTDAAVNSDAQQRRMMKNKAIMCRPITEEQLIQCQLEPSKFLGGTVMDENGDRVKLVPVPVPVPTPVFIPVPVHLYTQYTPVPLGLPLPIPVPVVVSAQAAAVNDDVPSRSSVETVDVDKSKRGPSSHEDQGRSYSGDLGPEATSAPFSRADATPSVPTPESEGRKGGPSTSTSTSSLLDLETDIPRESHDHEAAREQKAPARRRKRGRKAPLIEDGKIIKVEEQDADENIIDAHINQFHVKSDGLYEETLEENVPVGSYSQAVRSSPGVEASGTWEPSLDEPDHDLMDDTRSCCSGDTDDSSVWPITKGHKIQAFDQSADHLSDTEAGVKHSPSGPRSTPCPELKVNKPKAGGRDWKKKQFCFYCQKPYIKIARHLERKHADQADVAHAVGFLKGSKRRRLLLELLRKKGNYWHNVQVLKSGRGELITHRRSSSGCSASEYVPCPYCLAFYFRHELGKHERVCNGRKYAGLLSIEGGVLDASSEPPPFHNDRPGACEEILSVMRQDVVTRHIRGDALICKFGEGLVLKHGSDKKHHVYIVQKMRQLARFVLVVKELDGRVEHLHHLCTPSRFDLALDGAKKICGLDDSPTEHAAPSLLVKIGYSLRQAAKILNDERLLAGEVEAAAEVREFIELLKTNWIPHCNWSLLDIPDGTDTEGCVGTPDLTAEAITTESNPTPLGVPASLESLNFCKPGLEEDGNSVADEECDQSYDVSKEPQEPSKINEESLCGPQAEEPSASPRGALEERLWTNVRVNTKFGSSLWSSDKPFPKPKVARSRMVKNGKRQFCVYCKKPFIKIARHLSSNHADEQDVAHAISFPKCSKARILLLRKICNRGNYLHNLEVLKNGDGEIVLRRRRVKENSSGFQACPHCLGFYSVRSFFRHEQVCKMQNEKQDGNDKSPHEGAESRELVSLDCLPEDCRSIVSEMIDDDVSDHVRNDALICKFGSSLYKKDHHDTMQHNHISQEMRELGRFMLVVKELDRGVQDLQQVCTECRFDLALEAAKKVCGFNPSTDLFRTKTALKLGSSLKNAAEIALGEDDLGAEARAQTSNFINRLESEWFPYVTSRSSATRASAGTRVDIKNLTQDIIKLENFLTSTEDEAKAELLKSPNAKPSAWKRLRESLLAKITLFNKGRKSLVYRTLLKDYETKKRCDGSSCEALSQLERILNSVLFRIDFTAKDGSLIPLLLTERMVASVDVLIRYSKDVGVPPDNPYLFPPIAASTCVRARDWLRTSAQNCGATSLTSLHALMLKPIATVFQILSLDDCEMQQVAKLVGVDEYDYQTLRQNPVQLAEICKRLHSKDQETPAYERNQDDSGAGGTSVGPGTHVDASKCRRKKWEKEEQQAIRRQLGRFLTLRKVPGKTDCLKCVNSEPDALKSRTWTDVKNYIHNTLQSRKRKRKRKRKGSGQSEDDSDDGHGDGEAPAEEAPLEGPSRKRKRRWRRRY